jgi:hypothetical protein
MDEVASVDAVASVVLEVHLGGLQVHLGGLQVRLGGLLDHLCRDRVRNSSED